MQSILKHLIKPKQSFKRWHRRNLSNDRIDRKRGWYCALWCCYPGNSVLKASMSLIVGCHLAQRGLRGTRPVVKIVWQTKVQIKANFIKQLQYFPEVTVSSLSVSFDESIESLGLENDGTANIIKLANDITHKRLKRWPFTFIWVSKRRKNKTEYSNNPISCRLKWRTNLRNLNLSIKSDFIPTTLATIN